MVPEDDLRHDNADRLSADGVQLWLKSIGTYPRLDHLQELALARRVAAGISYTPGPKKHMRVTHFTPDALAARNRLVECNLRLVVSVAKRFTTSGHPFLDLIQEGNMGIMHAADKFDYQRDNRFSTYAIWWIKQAIYRYIYENRSLIKLPVHIGEKVTKCFRLMAQMAEEQGYAISLDEFFRAYPERDIPSTRAALTNLWEGMLSLDVSYGTEQEGVTFGETLADERDGEVFQFTLTRAMRQQITTALAHTLNARDQAICKRSWYDQRPLDEIAAEFHLTRERVRQITRAAAKDFAGKHANNSLFLP